MQSGGRQLWTGRDTRTLTSDGTATLAQILGVSEASARRIGEGVDMAIPIALSFGLGAVRVVGVRSGRIVLAEHEALAGSRIGGHTILKHIGQTDAQLAARLASRRYYKSISTFNTMAEAERAVSGVMRAHKATILAWTRLAYVGDTQQFTAAVSSGIGRVLVRGAAASTAGTAVRIVIKKETHGKLLWYVLTAFPIK